MKSDVEIAHACKMKPIGDIAHKIGINEDNIEQYGKYIAKLPLDLIDEEKAKNSNLILVTAITPTKAGIGKTTVSIGLSDALQLMGYHAAIALREPSLGPCFGMKGGATGGGYAQVLPMERINLHFTGDFHAITSANNMIAALLDNYIYQHRDEGFVLKEIFWRRVMDVNDRNLRTIITGIGGKSNGIVLESGFDITPASEIMALLCLAKDIDDLKERIGNIVLGVKPKGTPFLVRDMDIAGAITALLVDAIKPNLVQTLEGTPAFIHGGPFANIAHGCNSIIATKMALSHADYVVTEAGFGADLGAEKFLDIKCRIAGLQPKVTVLVATIQGLKMHGGVPLDAITRPAPDGLRRGLNNLDKHIENMRKFGQQVVVTLNHYACDEADELDIVSKHCEQIGVGFALNDAFIEGGKGCVQLAKIVADTIAATPSSPLHLMYEDEDSIDTKIRKVCQHIYGAVNVEFKPAAMRAIQRLTDWGYDKLPVCIAKTQYSFSDDAKRYGVPKDFSFTIRDIIVNAGAGMIVAVAGDIMRMPGLPAHPNALDIDVVSGQIVGLS